jgi:hypothetical protein
MPTTLTNSRVDGQCAAFGDAQAGYAGLCASHAAVFACTAFDLVTD